MRAPLVFLPGYAWRSSSWVSSFTKPDSPCNHGCPCLNTNSAPRCWGFRNPRVATPGGTYPLPPAAGKFLWSSQI